MGETILIIEDEDAQRLVLKTKLEHEGYDVLEARNGEEGLAIAIEKKPDLILLDIVMPKMDGVTTLKKLRKDEWGRGVNVLILTNLTEAHVALDDENIQAYLVKANWGISELVKEIRKYL